MVCRHLASLEEDLLEQGVPVVYRGKAWQEGSREWVYFDTVLDCRALRKQHRLPECVVEHEHRGTHDGSEKGFVCVEHQDAVMGKV